MSSNPDGRQLGLILLTVVAALVVFPALFMSLGMMGVGGMMGGTWGGHMWDGGTTGGWYPLIGLVMQLLFLLALVGGSYLLYRAVVDDDSHDRAIEELRSAYARGELTDEEYENRREALERDRKG
ncbi:MULTISPECIES: SHOCT domain-containing protein [Halolamina]|uniref:Putative membrane protein n=1 Tax=Halolamina pelagica TaxID=699431 RepID=A0A1I5R8C3_9EURY|nr:MULTISPECIES: SHOCT domain-containing protein [Halolamina]NHX35730.1 SHOCT domain-containing protein [Halolamina sp. R1-12]SFP54650.1 putative membrane protein [Halolamina pelagica]